MTIACYDQDKIIKYNGLINFVGTAENKTMLLPLSQTHTQTHTQHLYIELSNFLSVHFHRIRLYSF